MLQTKNGGCRQNATGDPIIHPVFDGPGLYPDFLGKRPRQNWGKKLATKCFKNSVVKYEKLYLFLHKPLHSWLVEIVNLEPTRVL